MTIKDGCPNSISVILNENIILFGHDIDSNFKSDNTLDLIILRATFFYLNMQNEQEHTTVVSVQMLLKNYIWSRQMYSKTKYVSQQTCEELAFLHNASGNLDYKW